MRPDFVLSNNIGALYLQHKCLFVWKKSKKKGLVLWQSVLGSIWLERNTICFNNDKLDLGRIIKLIKRRSWSWLGANKEWNISYVVWCIDPLTCLRHR